MAMMDTVCWIDWITAPIIIYIAIVPIGTAWGEAEKGPFPQFLRWFLLLFLALAMGTAVVVALGALMGWAPLLISIGFTLLLSGTIVALVDWNNIRKPRPSWAPLRLFIIGITADSVILLYLALRYASLGSAVGSA